MNPSTPCACDKALFILVLQHSGEATLSVLSRRTMRAREILEDSDTEMSTRPLKDLCFGSSENLPVGSLSCCRFPDQQGKNV